MKKASQWSILFLLILIIVTIYWVFTKQPDKTSLLAPINTPTPTKSKEIKQTFERKSSDQTILFTETIKKLPNGYVQYTFEVPNKTSKTSQTVYDVTEDPTVSYLLPDNSWSPDNKQFFITKSTPWGLTYLIFKADGTNYSNGAKFHDIQALWSKTKYTSTIRTATGWGGNDLVILKTTQSDGTPGPDFWFVTSTHGFLQLRQL